MEKILSLQKQLGRARWLPPLVILLTLGVLGGTIYYGARQLRGALRAGIVEREGEVLDAVAMLQQLGAESSAQLTHQLDDTAGQLALALRLSKLREGVVAVRLYDAQGRFVVAMPAPVKAAQLSAADQAPLWRLQPVSRYEPKADLAALFHGLPGSAMPHAASTPLLTVLIPLHAEGSANLLAVAELIQDGSGVARAFAALDRHLAGQALLTFLAAGGLLALALSWSFRRLQTITRRLEAQAVSLRQANQELALTAKTSALGAVTAHVVHGLTSPLNGLQNFLAAHVGNDAAWQDAVQGTQRMQTLIGEIVRILGEQTEKTRYELPLSELAQILSSRIRPVARNARVGFEVQLKGDCCLANRNANLVLLILENLLRNAIEATPPGKVVRLSFCSGPTSLTCEVRDEGSGLPEAARRDLFSPGHSTKPGGNGIGLALSHHLARHLGAELVLAGNSAAGCVFQLRLPAELLANGDQSESPAPADQSKPHPPGKAMRLDTCVAKLVALLLGVGALSCPIPMQAVTYPLTWRWSNPTPHGANIVDLAFSSGLGVQVGERGQIFTSTNFSSWTPRDSHTTRSLRGVTFFGGRIVISGENGTILFADDATEFYLNDLGTSDWLEGVAASTNLVVAVGDNGAIYTSDNAVTWTRKTTSFTTWLRSVAWGPPGFVAVGENGFIANSASGNIWNVRTSPLSQHLNRVAWLGDRYWAVGDAGPVVTSTNGVQWAQQTCGATSYLYAASGDANEALAAGEQEVWLKADNAWTSELTATRQSPPPLWSYYSALWDGASYWLGGATGMWVQGARTNSIGETAWNVPGGSVRNWLWAVRRTPYFYLAVGDHGTVMASNNGIDWDLDLVPETVTNTVFLGVGVSSNTFYAVGSAGRSFAAPMASPGTALSPDRPPATSRLHRFRRPPACRRCQRHGARQF